MIDTVFSADRKYRYTLGRCWTQDASFGFVNFVLLNPSTADETGDDPTIRRCIGFAKRQGFGAMVVTNLFAYRATNPQKIHELGVKAIGEDNDYWIGEVAGKASRVIVAWGTHGIVCNRGFAVLAALRAAGISPWSFGFTNGGHPKHPLYLLAQSPLFLVGSGENIDE